MKPLARWAVFSLTTFILTLSTVPTAAQTYSYVTAFTLSGDIIGSSTQVASGTIQITRAPQDANSNINVSITGSYYRTLTCPLMWSGGCTIPVGQTSSSIQITGTGVSQTSTATLLAAVNGTPDPGLTATVTIEPVV